MKKSIYLLISIWIFGILPGCKSIQKSIETGDYDTAIELGVKKLSGKKKDDETIHGLEIAYQKATEKDKLRLNQIKNSGNPAYWPEIYSLYNQMECRQGLVAPLTPLKYANGKEAEFETFDLFNVKEEARNNAAAYYYDEGKRLLDTKDKLQVRKAFETLSHVNDYFSYYKDTKDLLDQAFNAGTNKVYVFSDKRAGLLLPLGFEDDLGKLDFQSNAPDWVAFYINKTNGVTYDYIVKIMFNEVQMTPEQVRETRYDESKEIQDGWNYVYDWKGNVQKDSMGNDIKTPKYVIITAHITETQQQKASKVMGEVEIRDGRNNGLIERIPVEGNAVFSNYYATVTGNTDALKPETRAKIGNRPVPFPSDMDMVLRSKDELKNSIYRAVTDRYETFTH